MSDLQLFPPLDAATEAALRASIERFGVIVPVVEDQHGRILDGHNRARIATELGVGYTRDIVKVSDDEEAREYVRTLNADRRHLTPEQRREVVATLREEGHSLRAIAGAVGVSHQQVARDVAGVTDVTPEPLPQAEGQEAVPAATEAVARVTGQDGKSYPARRSATGQSKKRAVAAEGIGTRPFTALDVAPGAEPQELSPEAGAESAMSGWVADLKRYVAGIVNVQPPLQVDSVIYRGVRRQLAEVLTERLDWLVQQERLRANVAALPIVPADASDELKSRVVEVRLAAKKLAVIEGRRWIRLLGSVVADMYALDVLRAVEVWKGGPFHLPDLTVEAVRDYLLVVATEQAGPKVEAVSEDGLAEGSAT